MGQLTISFLGLCSYFHNLAEHVPLEFYTTPRRMVLVNASDPPFGVPHLAQIQMTQQDRLTVLQGTLPEPSEQGSSYVTQLLGATISVLNAVGEFTPDALCLPQLRNLIIPASSALPQPNDAVYAGDWRKASCYVDFGAGRMSGRTLRIDGDTQPAEPPSIAQLTIETSGMPLLQILPFRDSPMSELLQGIPLIVGIPPTPGTETAHVNIVNLAHTELGFCGDADFALNALLLQRMPDGQLAQFQIPPPSVCPDSEIAYGMTLPGGCPAAQLTPGCSTSGYP